MFRWEEDYTIDSKGNLCYPSSLNKDGCCETNLGLNLTCEQCDRSYECCKKYESCVGCCMEVFLKEKRDLEAEIQEFLKYEEERNKDIYNEYKRMLKSKTLFEWCLYRCRTSSRSLIRQNQYRGNLKFCFGRRNGPLEIK